MILLLACNPPLPDADSEAADSDIGYGEDSLSVHPNDGDTTSIENELADEKPNIIIVYADDMGYLLGCYGSELAETPHIDSLARHGARFTNGYVSACVCSPSRAALLTGRYQQRTGHDGNTTANGQELDENEQTIADVLKARGYRTGLVGKWHLGHFESNQLPLSKGFDYFIGNTGNITDEIHHYYKGNEKVKDISSHPRTTGRWVLESKKFINESKDEPFFLYLSLHAIHTPLAANKRAMNKYSHYKPKRKQRLAAVVDEVDKAVGDIMEHLRKLSLEENTLVFFISDNGLGRLKGINIDNGGLRGRKWQLFEGGIRIPYIVYWKGKILPNQTINEPVIQLDVLPTVLSALEDSVSLAMDGVDLLPLLEGNTDTLERERLYWRFGSQYAIRKGNYKLVKAFADQETPYLFDLEDDISETKDISEEKPEIKSALQMEWEEWNSQLPPPRWEDHRWNITMEKASEPK